MYLKMSQKVHTVGCCISAAAGPARTGRKVCDSNEDGAKREGIIVMTVTVTVTVTDYLLSVWRTQHPLDADGDRSTTSVS
jgi:hypothetical protein